ncbi:hypothetical protein QMU90_001964 [Edwardsiella ictaluri]|nr:hypothetical protein [Edwardsiella ictaluri]
MANASVHCPRCQSAWVYRHGHVNRPVLVLCIF